MNTPFSIDDRVYKKKYMGHKLRTDKTRLYTIISIRYGRDITLALLDDGTSFDIVEDGIEYAEKEEQCSTCLCM
jgi:hypothetical protein